jgi:hypothetical protein
MATNDFDKLREPFPASDIEWRIQQSGVKNGKGWAMALAYVTNRAIQSRLDEVVGAENWKNEYSKAPDDGVLCGISIRVNVEAPLTSREWVTKFDGAENTQVEAVKGGLSGAMKRAAVQWGIGRYLYNLESTFVETSDKKVGKFTEYLNVKDPKTHQTLWTGYWAIPDLPAWAMPAPEKTQAPEKSAEPKPGLIKPASMDRLKTLMRDSGYTGASATNFVQMVIGTDAPTSESEVQELIEALGPLSESREYLG